MYADKRVWESAEIQRSALEAAHTPDSRLVSSQANLNRYVAPPLDTVFPLEYAFAVLGEVRGHRVLDLGCGSGENTLLLARRGARLVSVDISASLIRLAPSARRERAGWSRPVCRRVGPRPASRVGIS